MFGERSPMLFGSDRFERACGDLFLHESLDEEAAWEIVSATHDAVESIRNRRSGDMLVSKEDNLDRLLNVLVARRTDLTQQEINQRIGASVEPLDVEKLWIIRQLDALPVTATRSELRHAFISIMSEVNLTEMDILPKYLECRSPLINEKHEPVEEYGPSRSCWDGGELLASTPFMKFDADTCELFYWENALFGTTRVAAFKREDIGVTEMVKTDHYYGHSPAQRMRAIRREERPGYELEKTIEQDRQETGSNAGLTKFATDIVIPTGNGHIERHYETAFNREGAMLSRAFQFKRYVGGAASGLTPHEVESVAIEETDSVLELKIETSSGLSLKQKFGQ